MRKNIRQLVTIMSKCLPFPEPIYEFGSLKVPSQEGVADLRSVFKGHDYIGADMCEGPGVDKVLNLHDINLPSESVGSVLCFDTLEHVEYPHKALQEIHRILMPKCGIAVIGSVMNFPIHDYPHDYWRFTPAAFESLLKPFKHSFVGFAGKKDFPHTVIGLGFKGDVPNLSAFMEKYKQWQRMNKYDLMHFILQVTPPVFLPSYTTLTKIRKILRRTLAS